MYMTEGEIRRDYAGAKNKSMQIGILADLNCCTKDRIREILGLIPCTESTVEIAEPDGNSMEKSVDKDAIMSRLYSTLDNLDREIKQMMIDLVEMPEENFNDCQEYVKNIDASDKTKAFFEEMMRVALAKRKKLEMIQGE